MYDKRQFGTSSCFIYGFSITQNVSKFLESNHAIIFLGYKSMILVRYTNPSIVQIYVISIPQTTLGRLGLNCSLRIFCTSLQKSEFQVVIIVHGRIPWTLIPICFIHLPTVLSEMVSPALRSSLIFLGAP